MKTIVLEEDTYSKEIAEIDDKFITLRSFESDSLLGDPLYETWKCSLTIEHFKKLPMH